MKRNSDLVGVICIICASAFLFSAGWILYKSASSLLNVSHPKIFYNFFPTDVPVKKMSEYGQALSSFPYYRSGHFNEKNDWDEIRSVENLLKSDLNSTAVFFDYTVWHDAAFDIGEYGLTISIEGIGWSKDGVPYYASKRVPLIIKFNEWLYEPGDCRNTGGNLMVIPKFSTKLLISAIIGCVLSLVLGLVFCFAGYKLLSH